MSLTGFLTIVGACLLLAGAVASYAGYIRMRNPLPGTQYMRIADILRALGVQGLGFLIICVGVALAAPTSGAIPDLQIVVFLIGGISGVSGLLAIAFAQSLAQREPEAENTDDPPGSSSNDNESG